MNHNCTHSIISVLFLCWISLLACKQFQTPLSQKKIFLILLFLFKFHSLFSCLPLPNSQMTALNTHYLDSASLIHFLTPKPGFSPLLYYFFF